MTKSIFMLPAIVAMAGCSFFGTTPKRPEPVKPAPSSADKNLVELTVTNATDVDICRIHVREDALRDAYGWSTNQLAQHDNPKPIRASSSATIKLFVNKAFVKPDVHALDCSNNTVLRVYDKAAFSNTAGSTWTIERADEGTIAAVQQERGIKKSVHPLNRKDPTPSTGGSIEIEVVNKCSSTVGYCLEHVGKSPSTLNGGASQKLQVSDGDAILQRSGSSCGAVIYKVTAASNGQQVILCQ